METPNFIKKIDWSELRNQKRLLLETINNDSVSPEHKEALEGILALIDATQDYAVDEAQIVKAVDAYDFEAEEEREEETVNQKFARESADSIFMELRESEFFHTDDEMPTEFIEGIMANDEHEVAIKGLIRMQILEDIGSKPTAFIYDNNIPVYDANMRTDYEFVATNYCRNIFNAGKTKTVLVCSNCDGQNVETKAWINPNNNNIGETISCDSDDCWCNDCEEHHTLILKEIPLNQ